MISRGYLSTMTLPLSGRKFSNFRMAALNPDEDKVCCICDRPARHTLIVDMTYDDDPRIQLTWNNFCSEICFNLWILRGETPDV